ncbi:MAG: antirestriction protein [Gammaproteobacteria bacterium]
MYSITVNIADDYNGSYWEFYELSNGGFYMAPRSDSKFNVSCENGFEGQLSADALGIVACLYAHSNLSFSGKSRFDEICVQQYITG